MTTSDRQLKLSSLETKLEGQDWFVQRRNSGLLDGEHGSGRQEMQRDDVIEEDTRNRVKWRKTIPCEHP